MSTAFSSRARYWNKTALLTSFFGFFGFIVWACLAPVDSASVATGKVIAQSRVQTIQHLEGGIIETLHVREGDTVKTGDLLISLSPVKSKAQLMQLTARLNADRVRLARLQAEQQQLSLVEIPENLLSDGQPELQEQIALQKQLFLERRQALTAETNVLKQQIDLLRSQHKGGLREKAAKQRQVDLLSEELAMIDQLLINGHASKLQQLQVSRSREEIVAELEQINSALESTHERVRETELKITSVNSQFQEEASREIESLQKGIAETRQAMKTAEDILSRVQIVSPVNGSIVSLFKNTLGGVINPGEPVLDISPEQDHLIIEGLASANDIDVLFPGLPARVRLSAFNFRDVPPVDGELIHISADTIMDPQTERNGYRIQVSLSRDTLKEVGVEISPGMPAEIMITTGQRTLMEYLLEPILVSANRAFRETG
ncbi:HlyD family type I secretion periplasmic adaptor subunit [Endozoicomonas ascidiicola]|uniref:HlyD family type I secretion periplasmic adaptor subunit n=1 Tax=Endozoicomonas ascidiicola TaxID=1698521 RepID=UPI000833A883|nr:HlyD family type I secretion periplasmic adaptor subunit [Endozoicomonas ascidiicola]